MNHKTILILLLILAGLLVLGCAGKIPLGAGKEAPSEEAWDKPHDYCVEDSDCICKGLDDKRHLCFIGNKEYYDLFIDKTKECPAKDYCTGPEGNLAIKCVDSKCLQMYECLTSSECGEGMKCVKNKCVAA